MTSDQNNSILCLKAPSNFRVIAIISTYNEEDIIVPVVEHLREEGIEVYIVDNWSTDSTYEIVKNLESDLCGLERYPQDRPSETYDWEEILDRKEALSKELDADWFMHHDADEIREAPWKDLSLKDAIYLVDQLGYNAIDFFLLNFPPVDNNYQPGTPLKQYFQYYEINEFVGNEKQEKAWKKINEPVNLSKFGGHILDFPGLNVFPYKFIMRHYPIRSQAHGEKKIYSERQFRYNPLEKERGWHTHYDNYVQGINFLKNQEELIKFQTNFYHEFMIKQVIAREKAASALMEQLADTTSKLADSQAQQTGAQTHLSDLQAQLAETQTQLAGARSQLVDLQAQLAETQTQLAGTRSQLVNLQAQLAEKQTLLTVSMSQLVDLPAQLAEKQTQLTVSMSQLVDLQAELAVTKAQKVKYQNEVISKENEILSYALSKSWRITRPLRKIWKFLRGQ